MMRSLMAIMLVVSAATLSADELLQFDNDSQRQLYQQLTTELRCPQCQNQNIADSHAVVAVDMRQKTYQLIREGKTRQQVIDYMVNRYGDFAYYLPPLNRYTLWLWLAPLCLLLALMVVGVYRRRQQAVTNQFSAASDQSASADTDRQRAEFDQLIERYRSKK